MPYLLADLHRSRRLGSCACPASVDTAGARWSVDKVTDILRVVGLGGPFWFCRRDAVNLENDAGGLKYVALTVKIDSLGLTEKISHHSIRPGRTRKSSCLARYDPLLPPRISCNKDLLVIRTSHPILTPRVLNGLPFGPMPRWTAPSPYRVG